ncbi:MAG: metallophosphoesterase [Bacilli bacterium]|nr:metallophosphoesterase [Bacilli bacterium]
MSKKPFLLLTVLLSANLASCGATHYDSSEYVLQMDYVSDFRILQLTDTHLGDKDDTQLHYKFMDLTIAEAKPNLIAVTGDLFTFASKGTALEFFRYLDGHKIPWTVIFGNHDEQCYFSIDWLTGQLNNYGSYCLFKDIQDDGVQGNCNFAINLMKGGKVHEQLIFMDSNRYYYGSYFGYDYFKQNQIDWYADLVDDTTAKNGGVVPSLMFYHIPLPEVNDAWAAAEANPSANVNGGTQGEDPCNPKYNSGFFDVIEEKGSTKGMYFGHDHVNNYIVNYHGIDFGYGVKATDRVYYSDTLLGGRVITVKDNNTMFYQDYYHTYSEVL